MNIKSLKKNIVLDLHMFPNNGFLDGIKYFLFNASFKLTCWLRIGQYLKSKNNFLLNKILYGIVFLIHKHNQYLTGIQIRIETDVKGGLRFQHFSSIIISEGAHIGKNCLVFQGVTVGLSSSGCPTIGNNVILTSGCKVIGGVHIGNNVIIGANAVVTHDIPNNSIAVGIPAKVISNDVLKIRRLISDYVRH